MGRKRWSDRAEHWNRIATAVLVIVVVVLVNRLASRDLRWRKDLSEDQLYSISDATRTILGRLEDRLLVKTYFTGDIESGDVALARARVEGVLADLAHIADPWVDIVALDPSASTAAEADTKSHGIRPQSFATVQGTQRVEQPVYMGVLLRYRGREQVIGWADPWGFEVQFASAVHALLSERPPRIGWYEGSEATAQGTLYASHGTARALAERRGEVIDIPNLRDGDPTGRLEDLDMLIVIRPREEHPRAAYEIESFVRSGGKLVVLVDQADYDIFSRTARPASDGSGAPRSLGTLRHVLNAWGALPFQNHVWDLDRASDFAYLNRLPSGLIETVPSNSPAIVSIAPEGFERTHPITAGSQAASFAWAQPMTPHDPPAGVTRVDLVRTSENTFNDEIRDAYASRPEQIDTAKRALIAGTKRPEMVLAAAFTGTFPSAFKAVPEPFDPLAEDPNALRHSDEPQLSEVRSGSVVVFGDADWIRDDFQRRGLYPFLNAQGNQDLWMNVIDYLALDESLIELRRKSPIPRELVNFEKEAQLELGANPLLIPDTNEEMRRNRELMDRASASARAEEWQRMLVPILISLALVLGFGLAWNLSERKAS